jgi:hypothetical protein
VTVLGQNKNHWTQKFYHQPATNYLQITEPLWALASF